MSAEAHPVLTILGTFVYCIASAVIPVFHAEAYLITMSALLPPVFGLPLILAGTTGQMIGKATMGERMHRPDGRGLPRNESPALKSLRGGQ